MAQDIKRECVTKSSQVIFFFLIIFFWNMFFYSSFLIRLKELAIQQIMIHIGSLKKDMIILEKSEFSQLRNENEVRLN
jgi:hypothetical protein